MCGIFGFFSHNVKKEDLESCLSQIHHRGPDLSGCWIENQVALGHKRLSIIDTSSVGRQPMLSSNGRWVIIFNGEIYNFLKIKSKLKRNWSSNTDTEVLLEAISEWGIKNTLKEAVGMFAFAAYDRENKLLYLARDRMGEKPLFYGWQKGTFLFGSELKALVQHPSFEKKIDPDSLRDFFAYSYVPTPKSIFLNTYKLTPGQYLVLDTVSEGSVLEEYWSLDEVTKMRRSFSGSFEDAVTEGEKLLRQTITQQMISDVPLGAFLSGGIDSSLVVSLMQKVSPEPVKTFTIGFNEKGYNEAEYAKKVADHLKTDHTELYISSKDALNAIPLIPRIYDEPMSDSSQIPTFLVSQLTKKHVTVSLSGDGGDEIFGGYNRYFLAPSLKKKFDLLPIQARELISKLIHKMHPAIWEKLTPITADKAYKIATVLRERDGFNLYNRLITHWADESPVKDRQDYQKYSFSSLCESYEEKMMFLDTKTYLVDDILAKVDRAGMAVSLETRIPFLDHRIVEFAASLPLDFKIKDGKGKALLREILFKHVPKDMIERPKMGFGVPIEHWLRHELKDWAEDLLSLTKLERTGLLDTAIIRKKWKAHLSGNSNWQYHLWDVLVFQMWYEEYFSS